MIDFWRFNAVLRAGAVSRAADEQPRHVEPDGVPAARGLRLRDHAVQLHRDWRQPDDRARDDGQYRDLEAGSVGDAERLLHDAPPRGGRHAARASSTSCPATPYRSRSSCSTRPSSPASTSPAARRCSTACGSASERTSAVIAAIRGLSAKPAARTSSSSTHPPIRRRLPSRSRAAGSSTRGRSAPPRAASTSRNRYGATSAIEPSR